MTKNEIVARFMGFTQHSKVKEWMNVPEGQDLKYHAWKLRKDSLQFDEDYNWLYEAWVKFRDLEFDNSKHKSQHLDFIVKIIRSICFNTITEAFDELVKGIEWYSVVEYNSRIKP